jgi:quercetin dioxygenase-like cupin family protein
MEIPFTYIEDLTRQLPEIPPDSIISRTVYSDDGVKVVLFGFAPGQELSEHTATQPAMLLIVAGEARLTLGDDAFEAVPGAWVHMAPKLPHSLLARTPVVMLLVLLKGRA